MGKARDPTTSATRRSILAIWAAKVRQLEMNYGAEADLKIILCAGIERAADVIGFGAQRDARIVEPVDAAANLNREAVLACASDLGIQMNSADQGVRPGRQALARRTPTDAGATRVKNIFCPSQAADGAAPRGDHVALETEPGREVVGQVGVQAAHICGELRGIKMNVFVADGEIPTIALVVKAR